MVFRLRLPATVSAMALIASPALAAPSAVEARLKALEDALAAQQQQIRAQQATIAAQQAEIRELRQDLGQQRAATAQAAPLVAAVQTQGEQLATLQGLLGSAPPADGVRGGDQDIWTVGVNWYPNANMRLVFDYMHVVVHRLIPAGPGNLTPFGASPSTPPTGVEIGQTINVIALRSQFAF